MQAELAAHHIGDFARLQSKGGIGKGLDELVALHPAELAAATGGLRAVVGIGNGGKAFAAVQFLADGRHGGFGLLDRSLVGVGSQRHKNMRRLDLLGRDKAAGMLVIPAANLFIADAVGGNQLFRGNAHKFNGRLARNGKALLAGFVGFLDGFFRGRGNRGRGRGQEQAAHLTLLAQVVVMPFCGGRVCPCRILKDAQHLVPPDLIGKAPLKFRHAHALAVQHLLINGGIKAPLLVLERGNAFHFPAHFQRRCAQAQARCRLLQQNLLNQIPEHAFAKTGSNKLFAGHGGIAVYGFGFRLLVGAFKVVDGNGLAVDRSNDIAGSVIRKTAHTPADEDQNDQAENTFDAE